MIISKYLLKKHNFLKCLQGVVLLTLLCLSENYLLSSSKIAASLSGIDRKGVWLLDRVHFR